MRHLIDPLYFSIKETEEILALAKDISINKEKYSHVCDGKKIATLFFEPSTRTRLSFEAAMMNLGGKALGFSSASSSSASKGETIADTIRVVSNYADIIAIRHPLDGSALQASQYSSIPIINAGDGGHQHPTQTLTDLLTIKNRHSKLNNLVIGLCGDLKFGRTVHSLIKALSRYEGNHFVLISPEELKIPEYIIEDVLKNSQCTYEIVTNFEEAMPKLDILYMTRIQKERFNDENEYNRLKDSYILTKEKMQLGKKEMAVLHPLPRVNEISTDVDKDERAFYFIQAANGVYVRMALIMTLLGLSDIMMQNEDSKAQDVIQDSKCKNERCITNHEDEIQTSFIKSVNGKYRCKFCDQYKE